MVTLALLPYIPESAEKLLDALSERTSGGWRSSARGAAAHAIERIDPLFPKLEAG